MLRDPSQGGDIRKVETSQGGRMVRIGLEIGNTKRRRQSLLMAVICKAERLYRASERSLYMMRDSLQTADDRMISKNF